MRPLFLLSNDDGYNAKGLQTLANVARQFGDVVVMSTEINSSAKSHSLTTNMPLRVRQYNDEPDFKVYACNGTPVDCVKLGVEHFCDRRPSLILSGINHGSNASINELYSGTIGAAAEGVTNGYPAIGFSLLDHHYDADFEPCVPFVREIISAALEKGLPKDVVLNVNFPGHDSKEHTIKGMKVCRAARAYWTDSFEKRIDPHGHPYWWLTGKFVCDDWAPDTDQWALDNGYVSIVPQSIDHTSHHTIETIKALFEK